MKMYLIGTAAAVSGTILAIVLSSFGCDPSTAFLIGIAFIIGGFIIQLCSLLLLKQEMNRRIEQMQKNHIDMHRLMFGLPPEE